MSAGASLRADFADDLARIHMESIGGKQSILSLKSLRATGVIKIKGETLNLVMWAARPNLLRTEITSKGRVLTEGYDGTNPPWAMDSKTGVVKEMGLVAARAFDVDADFDDPLVLRGSRPIAMDYAGEGRIGGKQVFKLLVTQNFTEIFALYLDRSTYFIIRREKTRTGPNGPEILVTEYSHFSPVNGVMMPYHIVETVGGEVRSETVLDRIEGNPALMPGLFAKPPGKAKTAAGK